MTTIDFHGVRLDMAHMGDGIQSAWEPEEARLIIQTLEPGDRVLVAGGGFGWLACVAASIVGADNMVVMEANPALVKHLCQNVRVNGRPFLTLGLALSDTTGDGRLWQHHWWGAASIHRRPDEHLGCLPVHTLGINEAVKMYGITALALDIEGSEWECVRALDWTPIRAAVIEVHDKYLRDAGRDPDMVLRHMAAGGLVSQTVIGNAAGTHRYVAGVRE